MQRLGTTLLCDPDWSDFRLDLSVSTRPFEHLESAIELLAHVGRDIDQRFAHLFSLGYVVWVVGHDVLHQHNSGALNCLVLTSIFAI